MVTLDKLRLKFLKIISSISIFVSILLVILFTLIGRDFPTIHIYLFILSSITIAIIKKYPQNSLIVTVYPITIAILYAFSNYHLIQNNGEILTYPFFLFPIFAFFLLGSAGGITISILHLLLPLIMFKFDGSIYGELSGAFIIVYLIENVALLFFEQLHNYLLTHIRKAANRDTLTGLENASGFNYGLNSTASKRNSFYLILVDFDYFSRINNNLGYTLCDTILIKAAKYLRDSDHVLHAARYYGDQFSLLIKGSREDVQHYIETKQKEIRNISNEMNIDLEITISSGIIHYPSDCSSIENLITNAELALFEAKKSDRETYSFFDSNSLKTQREQQIISNSLHNAILNEEIEVHFQPKLSVDGLRVKGMEALIRWNHPELGYLPPPRFIQVAEESGLIVEVGEYVIQKSLEHLSVCKTAGMGDLTMSINISPIHLLTQNFLNNLILAVSKYDIVHEQIYLEITENLLLAGDITTHLRKIQEAGFKLSLDDFGTGYSSLNYLRQFSFDELKIDKCFTDGLLSGTDEIQMFETILSIAKIFHMKTVIEGVEQKQQVDMISKMDVDELQGWYYSKALPSKQFIAYVQNI